MLSKILDNMHVDLTYSEWVPCNSFIFQNKLQRKLEETIIELAGKNIRVLSDRQSLIEKSNIFYNPTKSTKIDGEIYFLTKDDSFNIPSVIKTDRNKSSALYDPHNHTLFIHTRNNFGLLKSLVLGIIGDIQQKNQEYALHAGIAKEDDSVRAYIGPTLAGKTTHSLFGMEKTLFEYLTDDWSVWNHSGIAKSVDSNLMLANKKDVDGKKMFKAKDIIPKDNIKKEMVVDHAILLIPTKLDQHLYEVTSDEFVKYLIMSTYHLPFNYFNPKNIKEYGNLWNHAFDDVIKEKTEERLTFWTKMYDQLQLKIAVSTRNTSIKKTHEVIDNYVSRKL